MTFADQTVEEFLDTVASNAVTPSGGSVAAIGGAAGAALCEMVCIHTVGKDEYADVERELTETREELHSCRVRLLELADEDAVAVDELQDAFETPADEGRTETVRDAAKRATETPLEIAEACLDVLDHAAVVTEKGSANAVADAGTGAFLAYSSLRSTVETVRVNLETIDDTEFTAELERRSADLDALAEATLERAIANVGTR